MTFKDTFRIETPLQPRHPRLTRLLEQNKAAQRVKVKRAARRLLAENGMSAILCVYERNLT